VHSLPHEPAINAKLQRAELDDLVGSDDAMASMADNDVGLSWQGQRP